MTFHFSVKKPEKGDLYQSREKQKGGLITMFGEKAGSMCVKF